MDRLTKLDGGVGTEIEKGLAQLPKSEKVKNDCWVGAIHLCHPKIVKDVHKTYIRAGADIITANTYATNRHLLEGAGLAHRTVEAIESAVVLAKEARTEMGRPDVQVAGSVACHPPKAVADENEVLTAQFPSDEQQKKDYAQVYEVLCQSRVDMIFIELMKDKINSPLVMEAVADSMRQQMLDPQYNLPPIPVYLCLATKISKVDNKTLCLFIKEFDIPFTEDLVQEWIEIFTSRGLTLAGINVMHTNFPLVGPTIDVIRRAYDGPIGCYPDHGYWKVPEWHFEELDLEEALEFAESWVQKGVWMIGGCCGVGPDFVKALKDKDHRLAAGAPKPVRDGSPVNPSELRSLSMHK